MQIDPRLNRRSPLIRNSSPRRQFNVKVGGFRLWLALSAVGILGSLVLVLIQILSYARGLDRIAVGQVAAGVPVGGLTYEEAESRLKAVYGAPVVLDYRRNLVHLDPAQVKFQLDAEAMLSQASAAQTSGSVWADLWNEAWAAARPTPAPVPLSASYDQHLLREFVADLAARYDNAGLPARADVSVLGFTPGSAGYALDQELAAQLIDVALHTPAGRTVPLPVNDFTAAPPTYDTLADLLRDDIGLFQFAGIVSIYLADLDDGRTLNIAMSNGQPLDPGQGIAYSGMSTIKVPVMVTFFRYKEGPPTADEELLLNGIFGESANAYTDLILGLIGEQSGLIGANRVSDTMAELGLPNTYLAGLLDTLGAITTPRTTPGNSRPDINLSPDRYNQTSASDMGQLLVMIHHCTRGGGPLMEKFRGQFTADECQRMIDLLKANEVGPIFVTGGSPDAVVAHKHGWDLLPLNNVADAALVFSPGGNYALTIYAHHDEPVLFEYANRLLISLARAVYNFYNP
jgi:hypothetical protein